jgi:hypothetical protein
MRLVVSDETIRRWAIKFGAGYAGRLTRKAPTHLHDPFSSPSPLIGNLGKIAEALVLAVLEWHAQVRASGAVRTEPIDNPHTRRGLVCGCVCAASVRQPICLGDSEPERQDEAVLIDGAPKPMLFAIDGDDDLIQTSPLPELRRASTDFVDNSPPNFSAHRRAVSSADDDTTSPADPSTTLRQRGNRLQPNHLNDVLIRKAMTTKKGKFSALLIAPQIAGNHRQLVNVTVPGKHHKPWYSSPIPFYFQRLPPYD